MSQWESDKSVDDHYDEWCNTCQDDTEHSMGQCLECAHRPWPPKRAQVKNKKTAVQKGAEHSTMESSGKEDST